MDLAPSRRYMLTVLAMRLALYSERLLPQVLWLLIGSASYALLAFTPLSSVLGVLGHSVFISVLFYAAYREARRIAWTALWPTKPEAEAWLEARRNILHHPHLSRRDTLNHQFARHPVSSLLWVRHQQQAQEQLTTLRPVFWPRLPLLPRQHTAAMVILLLASAGLALGFHGRWQPLPAWQIAGINAPLVWQAWLEPPAYTGLPLIPLDPAKTEIAVPVGSRLQVQTEPTLLPPLLLTDGESLSLSAQADGRWQAAFPLPATEALTLQRGLQQLGIWQLTLIPDAPPRLHWPEPPAITAQQTVALRITAEDDYGVTELRVHVTPPLTAAPSDAEPVAAFERVLYSQEKGVRTLSFVHFVDLTDHPLVGQTAVLSISARDARGQESRSDLMPLVLPERHFRHPVAADIARIRKALRQKALAPDEAAYQLFKHLNDPLLHQPAARRDFLALSAAVARLRYSRQGTPRPGSLALLWDIALSLERQASPLAQRQLNEAFEALQQALLDPDTPEAELEALFKAYQQALMAYLTQQAQQGAASPQTNNGTTQELTSSDLSQWLKAIKDMQRLGQEGSALEQFQRLHAMMQNLQVVPPNPQAAALQQQMQAIGSVLNQQNALHQQTQQQTSADGLKSLESAQRDLQQKLESALDALSKNGLTPPAALGEAQKAMAAASDALGKGTGEASTTQQQQAIQQLRQALQSMMQQLEGMGAPQQLSVGGRRSNQPSPLAPPPDSVAIPEVPQRQQAQDIVDELRKRANDATRQGREREFLHRLLDLF